MRDWSKAFRRAPFRGVRFWVEQDGPEKGRRVAVHEISGGEAPVVEDMGRKATTFSVSGYVVSDLADIEGAALEAACDSTGPGLLTLPMDSGLVVLCTSCTRSRERDRNGYVGYDLSFVEAGFGGLVAATGISALREVFSAGLPDIGAVLSRVLG